ncbi:hypothetical protein UY3_06781 [Chelonia mydas]|uniref:Uncharacterized protein n=1 Tax=Chelonia mydas TaxID=8469 RepID=M7BDM0_CHEMY|nr:hypothetical protein UY3_06781 [Chelonia mydas]
MDMDAPVVPASSLSLLDEAITEPPHPVPQDDAKAHQELLKRVACQTLCLMSSAPCLQLRVANHQALLGRYDYNMWQAMAKFKTLLPEGSRKEFRAILEKDTTAARVALQGASDAADSAARTMASTISVQRVSWLLLSGLSTEAQQSMQDLPFDGQALFAEQIPSCMG